jgi:hypothetical protein
MQEQHLTYPVVLKPDVGQRGSGVAVVRSAAALESYLRGAESTQTDTIIQEYIPGVEFGVFYYRYPGEERGHIFSITDKRFPVVMGDGASTLERLILGDSRAVCMAKFYLKQQHRLDDVPAAGEAVQLVELGTHSRGAIFLDGSQHHTAALAAAVDRISQRFDGFSFGRFDIRAPSVEEFRQGRFKVIELNGVTSEATHIYDPQNGLLDAYRILFAQWRIAFAIGAANRARGAQPMPLGALLRMVATYRKRSGARSAAVSPTRPIA